MIFFILLTILCSLLKRKYIKSPIIKSSFIVKVKKFVAGETNKHASKKVSLEFFFMTVINIYMKTNNVTVPTMIATCLGFELNEISLDNGPPLRI